VSCSKGSVTGVSVDPEGHHISKAPIAVAKATAAAVMDLIIFFIASDQASAFSAISSIVIRQSGRGKLPVINT